ncbi:iron-sulfur cluster assembly protein [Actinoplanes sp. KI2]|uniref:iron-sulfur cluster assembly protein n=1 Tax=Actinoplanes sp. KI2 TaxID=2983315 RepID=UPI0021D5D48C|nr:iron-sulfur cluster assembly protein [Actinoplanes sp. KI2]MCU7730213.1 iron-sulfur cluster assembly protein [Actinoplanes sp. KI2]
MSPTSSQVWAALSGVRDPELDRPITDLGFVASVRVAPVRVQLRLPTYFCAPNFAWLMVADARDAVSALPDAGPVSVVLLDHFASEEINAAAFDAAFDTDGTDPSLSSLRLIFDRKAHVAAQDRLARRLSGDLSRLSLAEAARQAPDAAAAVVRRRARLGISSDYALCDDTGAPLTPEALPGWLRFARTVRVSIDGNAGLCRGLLETRYGLTRAEP